ncbi:MAG: tail protein X [Deltaproteobacteria bacterium]|nr:tail protein X [Deltaproteobacteria bacterium]
MAQQFITITTVAGQRWDQLAYTYYGDATLFGPIIQSNPQIPIEAVFEAGLTVGIPILTVNQAATGQPSELPPWRR